MTERVAVFDTTLRDGEQTAGVCFSERDKLEIAEALVALRVDVIEAGFPASSPGEARAVRRVAQAVRGAGVCAIARAAPGDVDAAVEAVRDAEAPRVHVFLSASDVHLAHQLRRQREEVVALAGAMVARARRGVAEVEFSPMDATRAAPDFLAAVVRAALEAGAAVVNVPDTVGATRPDLLAERLRALRAAVPELAGAVLSFHGQDDLGLATANALAAIGAGARQIEATVNGIGERAGNTALEEVAAALRVHGPALGVHTGLDLRRLGPVSQLVEARSGVPVPPNKAVVGRNAFRHASGIHQDGVLKHRETYEVLDPAEVGHPVGSAIVLGKLSGRAGFAQRAAALGFALRGAALDRAFARFQEVAARTREVSDETLAALCAGGEAPEAASPGFALDL
jgi:2-isopropylmalate synthase